LIDAIIAAATVGGRTRSLVPVSMMAGVEVPDMI
jgi:hypothetical protein